MIKLDYRSGKPLHEQIEASIRELVVNGALKAGERLPSVREMSVMLTVNPNTVQRAYKELEAHGVICSIRGKGSYISNAAHVNNERMEELYEVLSATVRELIFLGEKKESISDALSTIYKEANEDDRN